MNEDMVGPDSLGGPIQEWAELKTEIASLKIEREKLVGETLNQAWERIYAIFEAENDTDSAYVPVYKAAILNSYQPLPNPIKGYQTALWFIARGMSTNPVNYALSQCRNLGLDVSSPIGPKNLMEVGK